MKRIRKIWLVAALCSAAAMSSAGFAQGLPDRSEAAVDSLLDPPLAAVRPLRFERATVDVGTLREEDAPVRRRFVFKNRSDETVVIVRVSVGCRCLAAEWPKGGIAPGAEGAVELTYDPENHPGRIDVSAFVYVSGPDRRPAARLTFTGEVLPAANPWARFPHAMGALRLKQKRAEFRGLESGAKATERILCGNAGERPLHLSAKLIPPFMKLHTDPSPIPPGGEADIVITIDAAKIPASQPEDISVPVVLEGVDGRPSDRTLNIRINRINKNIID
ncbi:MAG: DUF1573 domain-containing protein [Alistipes sp.]|uniref:DUF1573 domain-containing protein n=1 Tax=Alistipes sp. TaxID=1872444 RepID=UPI0025C05FAF|nr:DUF1573 domain-containing protein [Alistipes sp.]MCD8276116.1 DUF1573 domain-containing protein [Alistipes sp.]